MDVYIRRGGFFESERDWQPIRGHGSFLYAEAGHENPAPELLLQAGRD